MLEHFNVLKIVRTWHTIQISVYLGWRYCVEQRCFKPRCKILSLYGEFCSFRYEGAGQKHKLSAEIIALPHMQDLNRTLDNICFWLKFAFPWISSFSTQHARTCRSRAKCGRWKCSNNGYFHPANVIRLLGALRVFRCWLWVCKDTLYILICTSTLMAGKTS